MTAMFYAVLALSAAIAAFSLRLLGLPWAVVAAIVLVGVAVWARIWHRTS